MRRTVLSALALACTAVLAVTVPASADTSPTTVPATKAPSPEPATGQVPRESAEQTDAPGTGEVSVVPGGAPDTGVPSADSGAEGGLIGGGAAAVFAAGGAAFYVVRRRRATGA